MTQPRQDRHRVLAAGRGAGVPRYLEYLASLGYITGEVEELELEELQGVQGLRALRVAIDVSTPAAEVGEAAREAAQTQLQR